MQGMQASLTARGAAGHRAVHQTLEGGAIFTDPFACAILGEEALAVARQDAADPAKRPMRLLVAARSRFAEDALAAAVARGVRQAVVLGAGLDTFALRNPHADRGLLVFEVDHPATQLWKRERLAQAGLGVPASLTFVPVDFERQNLADQLPANGFRSDRPAFFVWLGVVPYLTREAITATLTFIASLPGSEVVFDYSEPLENYAPERRARAAALAARVAALGEPFLSHFDPGTLASELRAIGFTEVEDLGLSDMAVRYFGVPKSDAPSGAGPHVIRARRE